jgi:hypothetical protein
LEGQVWCHLIDLEVNANSTAYFVSMPDTFAFDSRTYIPVPFTVGVEEQTADGMLPQFYVDVANYQGMALRFAKDNDLTLNDVTIRLVNTSLVSSGACDLVKMQILAAVFADEAARFILGFSFNFDAEGPRVVYSRNNFPNMPWNASKFFVF